MGTFTLSSVMKAFIFSSALLALAAADTCTDCTAVVNTIAARLMEEESIVLQQGILVGELWPGYWDPNAQWMCGPTCEAPEDIAMTCVACKMGIQAALEQLLAPDTIDDIVNILANGDFCAN